MKSIKCTECGFVGWSDADTCKGCGAPIVQRTSNFQPRPVPTSYKSWDETEAGQKKGLAVFALVLGIVSFLTFGLLGIGAFTGIIVASVAMGRVKHEPWQFGRRGMDVAGLVLSITSMVSAVPVGIVAAIAIPNLFAARMAANEASSVYLLRKISAAEGIYYANSGKYGTLEELDSQHLIDPDLGSGTKNGYKFTVELVHESATAPAGFEAKSVPVTYKSSGRRSFYVDETSVVRAGDNSGGPSSKLDEPLEARYENPFSSPSRQRVNRDLKY